MGPPDAFQHYVWGEQKNSDTIKLKTELTPVITLYELKKKKKENPSDIFHNWPRLPSIIHTTEAGGDRLL